MKGFIEFLVYAFAVGTVFLAAIPAIFLPIGLIAGEAEANVTVVVVAVFSIAYTGVVGSWLARKHAENNELK
ncbi:hypothetical protein CKO28_14305 [Rhodovibrio sodomensis]|uniref:Uncharacterized protein n=1 Tax=Rhodovibrio sodomensis TaxID=1088 RepID=A0ABS1DGU3_9PROT|nr:hypothetical protein [Rhodovibrio sodomensis]MBK1669206.1 hypothetical protein [Rhodovibrio sodomensis]